jgi:tRNA pseudouridine38-40 synthase
LRLFNVAQSAVPRYRALIEYDGLRFAGWQLQPGKSTVQGALEECLTTALRQEVRLHGSGRTDAGVHATGQVAHFDVEARIDPHILTRSVNGLLQERHDGAAVLLRVEEAPEGFHARYDAFRRMYHYAASGQPRALDRHRRWLMKPEPDWEVMNAAARHFIGEHHFGSFCIMASSTYNRICTVSRAEWIEEERPGDYHFVVSANRFLHGMVRAMVGTLAQVGWGRAPVDSIQAILTARDRPAARMATRSARFWASSM